MQIFPPRRLLALMLVVSLVAAAPAAEADSRTLYLVRHGYYDPERGADDKVAMGLNALGREQARFTAERLAAFPVRFTALLSSELTRARETADLIAPQLGLPCARTPHLNETLPPGIGIAADRVWPGAAEQLDAAWAHFSTPPSAGAGATHEVLVCHGNVIRWFVCRALGVEPEHWTRMEIANGSITMIQIRADGEVRVQGFNDIAHMPADRQTWSGKGPVWSGRAR